ncbi:MAG: selenite/tellurite reduction operon b-type cytochrome iron-sulfur cluster-binding subunit ExtO [Desulfuromonadales bacterium]
MYWIAVWIVLALLSSEPVWAAEEVCSTCHQVDLRGIHADMECSACHESSGNGTGPHSGSPNGAGRCTGCHESYEHIFEGPMTVRKAERDFVEETFGEVDPRFFEKNCASCHVSSCVDCHGSDGHDIARPDKKDCHACHQGYFVGADYYGMAPREDHQRYQRGPSYQGEHYLKMLPDVHAEAGMACGDCHSMSSLAGEGEVKSCRDCHNPDPEIVDHRITAHMEQMECYACHSAWGAQEYGTFFLRLGENPAREYFRLESRKDDGEYLKSAYLKKQDEPPLGINARGKISPIRPQFIAYYADLRDAPPGEDHRLLNARWKAFFPHTVRRGAVMCDGCHNNSRRFLLEADEDRIYQLEKDGLDLESFWVQEGQELANGQFMSRERFEAMSRKSPDYTRAYVEKWKNLSDRVETSSEP